MPHPAPAPWLSQRLGSSRPGNCLGRIAGALSTTGAHSGASSAISGSLGIIIRTGSEQAFLQVTGRPPIGPIPVVPETPIVRLKST
jgi:hypothetical protein